MSGNQVSIILTIGFLLSTAQVAAAEPGLRVRGAVRADVLRFEDLLRDGLADSSTLRELVSAIASDLDPRHGVEVIVVRNHPCVFIDSASTDLVDLEDLERLPSARDRGLERNEITREEQIVHLLAERRHLRRMRARLPAETARARSDELVAAAHAMGMVQENRYRAERGQVAVTDATYHDIEGSPGVAIVEYTLEDGTTSLMVTGRKGQIARIVPPFRPAPDRVRLAQSANPHLVTTTN